MIRTMVASVVVASLLTAVMVAQLPAGPSVRLYGPHGVHLGDLVFLPALAYAAVAAWILARRRP